MNEKMRIRDIVGMELIRADGSRELIGPDTLDDFLPKGQFRIEHRNIKGALIGLYDIPNLVVNQGKNDIFNTYFNSGTQITAANWAMGLISLTGFSSIVAGDTAASHAGWTEFTGYSETVRQAWGQGSSTAQTVTNSTPATFSINASGTVKGAFIISNNTKGGSTGILWAAALFSADVPVNSGDQLKITYSVSA